MNLDEAIKRIQELENENCLLNEKLLKAEKEKLEYKNKFEEVLSQFSQLIEKIKMDNQRMYGVKSERTKTKIISFGTRINTRVFI